jgi:hypothetical protein
MKQGKKKYMLKMMEKLLSCRKCGWRPHAEEYGRGKFHIVEIFCSNKKCRHTEAWYRGEINNAIKAWNCRTDEERKSIFSKKGKITVIDL